MRLKSLYSISVTNERIKRSCVANIFVLCLLSSKMWSHATAKHHRFVRQVNTETSVNYEDSAAANSFYQPHFTGNRSVVVQLFEWKFVDIAAECRDFLGPQGYAGVQLSPVLEHTVVKTGELNHPWWERYEFISYRLASRSGDESEFWSMSRICNEHGVRIYADVVLNHMAAPLHFVGATDNEQQEDFIVNTLLETNVNISQLNYSNVSYTQQDFHRPLCMVLVNAQDAHEIRNCQLNGHPDLDHSRGNVEKHIVKMLNKFVDMGVAGFRIDTAKHIWPFDLKKILLKVKRLNTEFNFKTNSRPFFYHDVFDLGLDTVSKTEYSTYGVVSEYLYAAEIATILNGKVPLSSLINWGPALGFLPHEDSLVFIDSHDTQRGLPLGLGNNRILTYKNRIKYIMANVFMLVHPYGAIKRIMSSYYFPDTNINQGPPMDEANDDDIRSPKFNEQNQCTKESGWVCEHRWPELVSMLKVANYFKAPDNKEQSVIYFQTNGQNQVAFCRGHKAFVAINNDPEREFFKEVYACLEPGKYCDVVTGGKKEGKEECHGKILEIKENGYTKLELDVADSNGIDYGLENEVGNEADEADEADAEGDGDTDAEEEELGRIENYGIIVIYVESKIKPKIKVATDKNYDDDTISKEVKGTANEEATQAEKHNDDNDASVRENAEGKENKSEEHVDANQSADDNKSKENEEETNNGADEAKQDGQGKKDTKNANDSQEENNVTNESGVRKTEDEGDADGIATSVENEHEVQNEAADGTADNETDKEEENVGQEVADGTTEAHSDNQIEDKDPEEAMPAENQEANEVQELSKESENNEIKENEGEDHLSEENNNNVEEQVAENDKEEGSVEEHEADGEDETSNKEINPTETGEENLEEETKMDPEIADNGKDVEEQQNEADGEDNATNKEEEKDIIETNTTETLEEESKTVDDTEQNQPRSMDEPDTDIEDQIKKPSVEIIDHINETSEAVTAKVQDIQKAGVFAKPQTGDSDG